MKSLSSQLEKSELTSLTESILDSNYSKGADKAAKDYLKKNPTAAMTLEEFLSNPQDPKLLKKVFGKGLKSKYQSSMSIPFSDGWLHCALYYDIHYSQHSVLFSGSKDWPCKAHNIKDWNYANQNLIEGLDDRAPQEYLATEFYNDLVKYKNHILNYKI